MKKPESVKIYIEFGKQYIQKNNGEITELTEDCIRGIIPQGEKHGTT